MAERLDFDPGTYEKLDFNPSAKAPSTAKAEGRVSARRKNTGILRKIDAGMRGAADFLTLGLADEAAAAVEAVPGLLSGGVEGYQDAYRSNLLAEQAIDQSDREQVPKSRMTGQIAGFAGTLGTGALANAGVRGAVAGRPIAQGLLQGGGMTGGIVRGATAGAALGAVQGAGSAPAGADNRIQGAQRGAMLGGLLGGSAAPVAGLIGAGVRAGVNTAARQGGVLGRVGRGAQAATGITDDVSARAMRYIGGDAEQMGVLAAERRAAGLSPTVTDVSGNAGLRRIRAAGVRSQAAGETLGNRAVAVGATAKPSVINRTRNLTTPEIGPGDMRTADLAATQTRAQRGRVATSQYGPEYARQFDVSDEAAEAIRSPAGRAAISEAMQVLRQRPNTPANRQVMAELETLASDGPLGAVSGSTLDEIQIFMRQNAQNLAESPMSRNTRMAGAIQDSRRAINSDLDNAPGLGEARRNYADFSRQGDILDDVDVPDPFTTDPRDYQRFVAGLSDGQRTALAKRVQQDLMDTLGGQRSATTGSLDTLTTSDFARPNLRQALGDGRANPYIANIEGTLDQVRNARFVDPNAGSRTAVLANDTQDMTDGLVTTGANILTGNKVGLARQAVDFLTSRQISKRTAERVAEIASDPASLDEAIDLLSREVAPMEAIGIIRQLQQLSTRNLSESMSGGKPQVLRRFTGPGGKPYVELGYPDNPSLTLEVPATDSIR